MKDSQDNFSSDPEYQDINRKTPRYAINLAVEIFSKGLNHQLAAKTANVSLNGLFVCTDLEAELEDQLHIRIILKDQEAYFDIRSKVVWKCPKGGPHPQGLGLQFTNLNKEQANVIAKHLKDYITTPAKR